MNEKDLFIVVPIGFIGIGQNISLVILHFSNLKKSARLVTCLKVGM